MKISCLFDCSVRHTIVNRTRTINLASINRCVSFRNLYTQILSSLVFMTVVSFFTHLILP